jgi:hypothetical protein
LHVSLAHLTGHCVGDMETPIHNRLTAIMMVRNPKAPMPFAYLEDNRW